MKAFSNSFVILMVLLMMVSAVVEPTTVPRCKDGERALRGPDGSYICVDAHRNPGQTPTPPPNRDGASWCNPKLVGCESNVHHFSYP